MSPIPPNLEPDTSEEATAGTDSCGFTEEEIAAAPDVELADPEEDD